MTDIQELEQAWRDEPGNLNTFFALEERYRESQSWSELIRLFSEGPDAIRGTDDFGTRVISTYEEILDKTEDPETRSHILTALGNAYLEFREDRTEAMRAYQTAHKEFPSDTTSLEFARKLYRGTGDYERVRLLYKLQLKVHKEATPERVDTLVNMAQISGDYLDDLDDAKERVAEALEIDPDHRFANQVSEFYASGRTVVGEQQEALAGATDASKSGESALAAEWLVMATQLEIDREGGTIEMATEYAERAYGLDPKNQEVKELLGGLYQALGRDDELDASGGAGVAVVAPMNIGEEGEEEIPRQTMKLDVSELAEMQARDKGEVSEAEEDSDAEEVSEAEEDSDAEEVSEAEEDSDAEEVSEAEEDSDAEEVSEAEEDSDAEEVSEAEEDSDAEEVSEAEEDSDAEEVSEAEEASEVEEEPVEEEIVASLDSIAGCQAILTEDPKNLDALDSYYLLAADEDGAWEAYLDQLEFSLKKLRKHEREADLMVRAGEIAWKELSDLDRAEYHFKRIKLIDGSRPEMIAFHEFFFEEREEWPKLYALLSSTLSNLEGDEQREYIRRTATLAEQQMGAPEKAVEVWRQTLKQNPQDSEALENLERLFASSEKWTSLIDLLRERMGWLGDDDTDERVEFLTRIANIYEEHLKRDQLVAAALEEVLQVDPGNKDVFDRLVSLYERTKQSNNLIKLLTERGEHAEQNGDVDEAIEFYFRVATLWQDTLKNVTQAVPILEKILVLDAGNQDAREALKTVFEKRRDFDALFELEKSEVQDLEGEDRVERLRELVDISLEKMRNLDAAIPLLGELLELVPGDWDALQRLEAIFRRQDKSEELAEVLAAKADATDDKGKKIAALGEAGDLYRGPLKNVERACELWSEILVLDEQNSKAMAHLTDAYIRTHNFDALDQLYRDRDDLDRLYDLLDSAAATTEHLALKAVLYRRMATIAANDLDAPDRVILSLESLRETSERPEVIAEELVDWYQKTGEVEREIEMHQIVLDALHEEEIEQAFDIQNRVCDLQQGRGRTDLALTWALKAVRTRPANAEARERAESFARETDQIDRLIEGFDLATEHASEETTRVILCKIGELYAERGDTANAIARFEAVRESDSDNLDVLKTLEKLYAQSGEWDRQVDVLNAEIATRLDAGDQPEDLIDARAKVARLQQSQIGNTEEAKATYLDILGVDPDHVESLRGLVEISRVEQDWDGVVRYSMAELEVTDDSQRAQDLRMSLGDIYRYEKDDPTQAISFYGQILDDAPSHEPAVNALESMLEVPEVARDAALLIEPVFRSQNDATRLAPALESRRSASNDAQEQIEVLSELVELYDDALADAATAFDRAKQLFSLQPYEPSARTTLESLGRKLARWEDVAVSIGRHAAQDATAGPDETDLARHLARIFEEEMGDNERSIATQKLLRELDPADLQPLIALERLYRRDGNQRMLVDTMVDRSELESDEKRIALLIDAAEIADVHLDDGSMTIDLFQKVLEVDVVNAHAIEHLRTLLRSEGRHSELAELLESQALETTDLAKRRSLLLELANVRTNQLREFGGSLELLRELIAEDARDIDALRELEFLDEAIQETDPSDPIRLEIADLTEPAYREGTDYRKLIQTLETRRNLVDDDFTRVELLDELALLYRQRVGEPESAFDATSEAVILSPDDFERRMQLESLAGQVGRLGEVVQTYQSAMENADPVTATALSQRVAELYDEHLDSTESAIEFYERALEGDDTNRDVLEALERLYAKTSEHEKLATNLRQQADVGDPNRRHEFLRRLGTLEDEILGRPNEAITAYNDLLANDPNSVEALQALERLYESGRHWEELCDVLRQQSNAFVDADRQIRALRKLANIREVQQDDGMGAIEIHHQILGVDSTDEKALDELERLYVAREQWSELADVYRSKLMTERSQNDDVRTEVEQKLADVLAGELFDIDEALMIQRGVLARHPGQSRAIEALEKFAQDDGYVDQVREDLVTYYRREESWDKLVGFLDRLQEKELDPDVRSMYLEQIGAVWRDKLDGPDSAITAYSESWRLNPERTEPHDALERLVAVHERWPKLVELYEEIVPDLNDIDQRVALHMRLGDLNRDKLDDLASAESNYEEALNIDERFTPAYEVLEGVLTQQSRFRDLVRLLNRRYDALGLENIDEGLLTLHRIAQIQDEVIDDRHAAVDTFERILSIDPRDDIAAQGLERLLNLQERWDELVEHYNRTIGLTTDQERLVELKTRMARVVQVEQQDPYSALDVHREILSIDWDHQPTVTALESYITDDVAAPEAAAILEPTYRQRGSWAELANALVAQNRDAAPAEIATRMQEVASIRAEHLDDAEGAIEALSRVFEIDPSDQTVREALEAQVHRLQKWPALAEAFDTALKNNFELSDDVRADLFFEKARIYEERMEELELAKEAYEEVLVITPEHKKGFDALDRVYARTSDWFSMATLYERRAELTNDLQERERWLTQLANLYEEVLDDLDGAIDVYQRLCTEVPDSVFPRRSLERLLGQAQRWNELADLYREQASVASDADVVLERRFRLANLYESELDRFEDALEIYRDILSTDPNHFEARRALEGLARDLALRGDEVRHERLALLDLLLEVSDPRSDRVRIVRWLEEREELVVDLDEKVRIYYQIAELTEHSDRRDDRIQAMLALARAFQRDPSDESLQQRINRIAVETNTWDRLTPIYLAGLEQTDDGNVQERLLVAIAEIYAGPMNDQDSAISAYQQVLEVAPDNDSALQHLEKLYSEMELWDSLVDVLTVRAGSVYDGDEKERVLRRVARIENEVLKHPDKAITVFQELRELNPGSLEYVASLEQIYDTTSRWRELEALLQEKVGLQNDPSDQVKTLRYLGRLQDQTLDDSAAAIESYRQVVESDPEDSNSIRALVRLFQETEQWHELLDVLTMQRDFIEDIDALNVNDLKTGMVLVQHVDAPYDALSHFREVIQRSPGLVDAREALMLLLQRNETRDEAGNILERTYQDRGEWRELEGLYDALLNHVDDPVARVEVYRKLARLQEEQLGNPQMAFITYGRALRESPGEQLVWASLERLSEQLDNPDEFIAVLEDCVESPIDDPDVERGLHVRLGKLYVALGENHEAIRHLRSALEIDEFDPEALELLDALYRAEENWEELAEILERRISIVDPDALPGIRYDLGRLRETVFQDAEGALDQYRQVIVDVPDHDPTIDGLERLLEIPMLRLEVADLLVPIFESRSDFRRLVDTLVHRLESLEHPVERAELLERIANIHLDEFGAMEVGYAYLCRSFRTEPSNTEVQIRLESLVDSTGMHEELLALYEEICETLDDTVRANELSVVSATLAADKLGDDRTAWSIYNRVLENDPENEPTLRGMEVIARRLNDANALAMVLDQQTKAFFDPDLRRDAFIELGALRSEQEQFDDAIDAYRQANLLDESNESVLRALIELFEITENYVDLVEHLEKLAYFQTDIDQRYATLKRMGQCAHVLMRDPHKAIDAYIKALEIKPGSGEAIASLKALYGEIENWFDYRELMRRQIEMATDNAERITLHFEAATVDVEKIDDPNSAIEEYRAVLAIDPSHDTAFETLATMLKTQQRWGEVRDLYQDALANTPESETAKMVDLQVQMAEVSAMFLGDEAGAISYLTSILEIDPNHQKALGVLADLYIRQSNWSGAVQMLTQKLREGRDPVEQAKSLMLRADIYRNEMEKPTEAANDYVRVIEIQPTHPEAMEALKSLYFELGAYPQIYDLMNFEATHATDTATKAAIFVSMAEIARDQLGDLPKTISALEMAYSLTPDELSVVEPLVNGYLETAQTDKAEPLVTALVEQLRSQRRMKDVVRFLHLQGRLAEQRGNEDAAWEAFDSAHKVDASYIPNLLSLGKLLYRRQAWDDALKIFQTLQLQQMNIKEDATKVDVYYHLGMIRWYQGDPRRAKDMFQRAISIDGSHEPSREALSQLG